MSATVISIMNWKGGVGKTSTALNLGYGLKEKGHKVLLLDLDGQANLSKVLPGYSKLPEYLPDIYVDDSLSLPIYEYRDNLHISPNHVTKEDKGKNHLVADAYGILRLKSKIEEIENDYDFIILDCGPSFSIVQKNAMVASDFILVPTELENDSIDGLKELQVQIDKIPKNFVGNLEVLGVVIFITRRQTNYSTVSRDYLSQVFKGYIFKSIIRESVSVKESKTLKMSVLDNDPESRGALDFRSLTEEVLSKISSYE